jgi:pimeloyl-ACP methyl ester carboxylesterase
MRFLVLHGGPGLNSFAERAVLGPLFAAAGHEAYFWNEPSALRPGGDPFESGGAFEHWLDSADRALLACTASAPVSLIAHSGGALAAIELARRHPDHLSALVLVAPSADPFVAFRNVVHVAHRCAVDAGLPVAAQFADCAARTRRVLDEPMRLAFETVLANALLGPLFSHYWVDQDRFRSALAAQAQPEAQFDVASFFAVLEDLGNRWPSFKSPQPVTTPTLVLFADQDPVTKSEEQADAVSAEIPHARIEIIDRCGHFIHLEQPDRFLETVVNWRRQTTDPPPLVARPR